MKLKTYLIEVYDEDYFRMWLRQQVCFSTASLKHAGAWITLREAKIAARKSGLDGTVHYVTRREAKRMIVNRKPQSRRSKMRFLKLFRHVVRKTMWPKF